MYNESERQTIYIIVCDGLKENLGWKKILRNVKMAVVRYNGSEAALRSLYYGIHARLPSSVLKGSSHEGKRAMIWLRKTFNEHSIESLWKIFDKFIDKSKTMNNWFSKKVDASVAAELSNMAGFTIKPQTLSWFRRLHNKQGYVKGRNLIERARKLEELASPVTQISTPPTPQTPGQFKGVDLSILTKKLLDARKQKAAAEKQIAEITAEMLRDLSHNSTNVVGL